MSDLRTICLAYLEINIAMIAKRNQKHIVVYSISIDSTFADPLVEPPRCADY